MSAPNSTSRTPLILHVVHSISHGGTERVLCQLARALHGNGARHMVCALREPGPRAAALGDDVELIALNARRREPLLFWKLARVIRQTGASIVHARNWGTWTDTVLATKLARGAQPILGFHGLLDGGNFTPSQRRRARILGMPGLPVATVSNAGRELLVRDLHMSPGRIEVIPNGVDVTRFAPADPRRRNEARAAFNLHPDDLVIGNTGAFKPVKDHQTLLDAFARLVPSHPRARLLLAGRGPLENAIRARVDAMGLAGHVVFTGWREDIVPVLAAMDIFVSSSVSEGMSSAVLEAMSAGLACVATDVADHRALLGPLDHALVPPAGDAPALSDILARLAGDPGRRQSLGAAARRIIQNHYAFDETCRGYQRLYDRLLAHRNVRPNAPRPNAIAMESFARET